MMEHGGNPACRMPVVKIDGCDRVTCSRCDISMCFKCPPDKMTPYEDAQDCYDHLDEVHGGYFWWVIVDYCWEFSRLVDY